jgi:hypothetical protein
MTLAECRRMLRLAFLLLMSGCVGDLVELTPGARTDMAQPPQAQPDLSGGGTTGGGGNADLAEPAPHFNPTIQADVDSLGCSAASCHGGTQVPVLKRLPITQADIDANYAAFKAEAMNGAQSNILVKNLAGSGVSHTGGSSFTNTQDAVYQRWLAWINGGTPE